MNKRNQLFSVVLVSMITIFGAGCAKDSMMNNDTMMGDQESMNKMDSMDGMKSMDDKDGMKH